MGLLRHKQGSCFSVMILLKAMARRDFIIVNREDGAQGALFGDHGEPLELLSLPSADFAHADDVVGVDL